MKTQSPNLPAKQGRMPVVIEQDHPEAGTQVLIDGVAQLDAEARRVAAEVGYQLPADSTEPDLICRDIQSNMRRSVEAVLEIGRGLLVLKAACSHGKFTERLGAMGIEYRLAARFMQAAHKYSNVSSTTHLIKKIGNQTKLFELLVLDDDQTEELIETGQTGDLDLDDVERMSVSELRRAIRAERERVRTVQANLSAEVELQAGKIKRLESKARLTGFLPETEALRAECLALQAEAELPINGLVKLFENCIEDSAHDDESRLRMEHVWLAAHAVAARAADLIRVMQASPFAQDMPERIKGEHIMTVEEAERWMADYRLIENRHEAAKALRYHKREEEAPRGRGRPKGSKNGSKNRSAEG